MPQVDPPALVRLSEGLGLDGSLHADGYFTWKRRDGYVLDAKLPADFVLAEKLPRWVPVGEALPPEHVTCAVRMDGDYIATAWAAYWHGARTDFARWVFPHDSDEECADKITHWLALPPLPAAGPNVRANRETTR